MDLVEILAWIPLAAAGISALGSLGGSFMSAQGVAGANAANVQAQNMANQQMLAMEMAKHEQNTAFQEDSQAHQLMSQHVAQTFNAAEAEKARLFSSTEAGRQMAFQYDLATSAYQRAMGDLKKAGLNPILAYQQGGAPMAYGAMGSGPAASGSGGSAGMASSSGSASLKAPTVLNDKDAIGRAMGNLVTTAVEVLRGNADIERIKADAKEKEERAKVHTVDTNKKDMETIKIGREAEKILEEKELVKAQTKTAKELGRVAAGEAGNLEKYESKQAPDTLERMLRMLQDLVEQRGSTLPK